MTDRVRELPRGGPRRGAPTWPRRWVRSRDPPLMVAVVRGRRAGRPDQRRRRYLEEEVWTAASSSTSRLETRRRCAAQRGLLARILEQLDVARARGPRSGGPRCKVAGSGRLGVSVGTSVVARERGPMVRCGSVRLRWWVCQRWWGRIGGWSSALNSSSMRSLSGPSSWRAVPAMIPVVVRYGSPIRLPLDPISSARIVLS